jgi:hypothetical protein
VELGWDAGKEIDDRPRLVGQSHMIYTKPLIIISRQHLSVKMNMNCSPAITTLCFTQSPKIQMI